MKLQKIVSYALFLLLIFLFTSSQISAGRFLANKQVKEEEVMELGNDTTSEAMKSEDTDSLEKLMGLEKCEKTDEECMKRRVIAEAHLDYIYTQHKNP